MLAAQKKFGKHPTQKPIALVDRCILASTKEGDLILDPFLGGGTTAVAAIQTRRRCVGFDLDEGNLKLSVKRVNHARHLFLKPHANEAPCPDAPSLSPTVTS